jgi:hypothetical protein
VLADSVLLRQPGNFHPDLARPVITVAQSERTIACLGGRVDIEYPGIGMRVIIKLPVGTGEARYAAA